MVERVHIGKVIYDLKSLKGYFSCVPRSISPEEDKGIYFAKALEYLDSVIIKYERMRQDLETQLVIECVWCLFCNHQFYIEKTKDEKYKCPKCLKIIDFHKGECRYIVDK